MTLDLFRQKAKAIVDSYGGLVPFEVVEKDEKIITAYAQNFLDESMRAILEEDSNTFQVVLHFGNPIIATAKAYSNKFLNANKDVTSEGHAHLQQQKSDLPDGKSSAMQGWKPHPNAVRPQQFQALRQTATGLYNPVHGGSRGVYNAFGSNQAIRPMGVNAKGKGGSRPGVLGRPIPGGNPLLGGANPTTPTNPLMPEEGEQPSNIFQPLHPSNMNQQGVPPSTTGLASSTGTGMLGSNLDNFEPYQPSVAGEPEEESQKETVEESQKALDEFFAGIEANLDIPPLTEEDAALIGVSTEPDLPPLDWSEMEQQQQQQQQQQTQAGGWVTGGAGGQQHQGNHTAGAPQYSAYGASMPNQPAGVGQKRVRPEDGQGHNLDQETAKSLTRARMQAKKEIKPRGKVAALSQKAIRALIKVAQETRHAFLHDNEETFMGAVRNARTIRDLILPTSVRDENAEDDDEEGLGFDEEDEDRQWVTDEAQETSGDQQWPTDAEENLNGEWAAAEDTCQEEAADGTGAAAEWTENMDMQGGENADGGEAWGYDEGTTHQEGGEEWAEEGGENGEDEEAVEPNEWNNWDQDGAENGNVASSSSALRPSPKRFRGNLGDTFVPSSHGALESTSSMNNIVQEEGRTPVGVVQARSRGKKPVISLGPKEVANRPPKKYYGPWAEDDTQKKEGGVKEEPSPAPAKTFVKCRGTGWLQEWARYIEMSPQCNPKKKSKLWHTETNPWVRQKRGMLEIELYPLLVLYQKEIDRRNRERTAKKRKALKEKAFATNAIKQKATLRAMLLTDHLGASYHDVCFSRTGQAGFPSSQSQKKKEATRACRVMERHHEHYLQMKKAEQAGYPINAIQWRQIKKSQPHVGESIKSQTAWRNRLREQSTKTGGPGADFARMLDKLAQRAEEGDQLVAKHLPEYQKLGKKQRRKMRQKLMDEAVAMAVPGTGGPWEDNGQEALGGDDDDSSDDSAGEGDYNADWMNEFEDAEGLECNGAEDADVNNAECMQDVNAENRKDGSHIFVNKAPVMSKAAAPKGPPSSYQSASAKHAAKEEGKSGKKKRRRSEFIALEKDRDLRPGEPPSMVVYNPDGTRWKFDKAKGKLTHRPRQPQMGEKAMELLEKRLAPLREELATARLNGGSAPPRPEYPLTEKVPVVASSLPTSMFMFRAPKLREQGDILLHGEDDDLKACEDLEILMRLIVYELEYDDSCCVPFSNIAQNSHLIFRRGPLCGAPLCSLFTKVYPNIFGVFLKKDKLRPGGVLMVYMKQRLHVLDGGGALPLRPLKIPEPIANNRV